MIVSAPGLLPNGPRADRVSSDQAAWREGLHQKAKGTTGWSWYEVPFNLKADERPDLIRLNVAFEGPGSLWVRNLELLQAPLR